MKTAAEVIREMIEQLEERQADMQGLLKETAKKIARLRAEAKALTPQRIRVPENIKFEEHPDRLLLALISPNGKCMLSADDMHGGIPLVCEAGYRNNAAFRIITDPIYLEPCKREDLKCGDVVFGTSRTSQMTNFGLIWSYGVVLNHDTIMRWKAGMEVVSEDYCYSNYYKVVR